MSQPPVSRDYQSFLDLIGGTIVDIDSHPNHAVLTPALDFLSVWRSAEMTPLKNVKGDVFRAECHYVAGPKRPNAIMARLGDRHCIAVYESVAMPLTEIAFYLFSRKRTLEFVGDPGRETDSEWPASLPLGLSPVLERTPGEHRALQASLVPRCPVRRKCASVFVSDMILAIWLHEYAHGTAGHANYWSAVYGASPLSEIDETPAYSSLTKEVAERQLFEGVADEGATSLMLAPFMLEWRAEQFVTDRAFDMTEWAVFRLLAIMMVQFLWCQMDRFFNGRDLLRLDSGGVYPISSSRLFAQILVVKRLGDIKQLRFEELSPALARALAELGVIASLHPQFAFIDRMLQPEKVRDFVNYVNEVARIADWREKKLKYQYSAIA